MSVNDPGDGRDGDVPSSSDQNGGPPLDVDTAFAAIVAGWSDEPAEDTGRWPAQENLATPQRQGTEATGTEDPDPGASDVHLVGAGGSSPMLPSLEIGPSQTERELDEGYIPPEPPPIPRGDLFSRLAWAGVLGGPLFLLLAAMFWREDAPQLVVMGAVGAFVAGFVTLVARMPQHHDDDEDDGAVV
jgi:hypothetical protein